MNQPYENIVVLIGKLFDIRKVHERLGAAFYEITLRVNRTTPGKHDDITVYAPEWALPEGITIGDTIRLMGEARIYKNRTSLWQAKCLKVYTKKITIVANDAPHTNRVELIGDIIQVWNKRTTPLTNRLITDFSLLVCRMEGYSKGERSDLIHCIAWGDSDFEKINNAEGRKLRVIGRVQERSFDKDHSDGTRTKENTHEISCRTIEIL